MEDMEDSDGFEGFEENEAVVYRTQPMGSKGMGNITIANIPNSSSIGMPTFLPGNFQPQPQGHQVQYMNAVPNNQNQYDPENRVMAVDSVSNPAIIQNDGMIPSINSSHHNPNQQNHRVNHYRENGHSNYRRDIADYDNIPAMCLSIGILLVIVGFITEIPFLSIFAVCPFLMGFIMYRAHPNQQTRNYANLNGAFLVFYVGLGVLLIIILFFVIIVPIALLLLPVVFFGIVMILCCCIYMCATVGSNDDSNA